MSSFHGKLDLLNAHPRDQHISFDEPTHVYTIKGDSNYTSVTTWNHSHFEEFDADAIIDRMMASHKWPQNKYFGMTKEEILASWEKNRDEAATAGTNLHNNIELFYNDVGVQDDSVEYQYFMNFVKDFPELKAYRTEWIIYDEEHRLAGSIDMLFRKDDGTFAIYDWKRWKEIVKKPFGNKFAKNENVLIPDTNFWHYSLQLNTYKAILERNYGIEISEMYLVCLHPNNKNKNYIRIEVADLEEEVIMLFAERKEKLIAG